jgi:hypothetical protein
MVRLRSICVAVIPEPDRLIPALHPESRILSPSKVTLESNIGNVGIFERKTI